jgi:hypothetical protein
MDLDPVFASRLQFGFTIIFHIIFPAFTIGLSAYIATLCIMWMASAKEQYRILAQFWTRSLRSPSAWAWFPALSFPISSGPTGAASASWSAT